MKAAYKSVYIWMVVSLVLLCNVTVWGYGHRYDSGVVAEVRLSANEIVMNGKAYHLNSNVKVILNVKEKGAYYKRPGRLSDLNQRDRVSLRVFGPNDVLEIEVMR